VAEEKVEPITREGLETRKAAPLSGHTNALEAQKLWAWNRLLLPLMIGMVVSLALFFFIASIYQLYSLQETISGSPRLDLSPPLAEMTLPPEQTSVEAEQELRRWKVLSLLEEHVLQQRYHQANVLLMARVWVRYLGFVTGMILALVGAVFVLGKLRESRTELSLGSQGNQGKISTHSPGLVLASLGTLLMLTTLVIHHEIHVDDGPLYVLLPYSKVTQPFTAKPVPEDVMNLPAASKAGSEEDAGQDADAQKALQNTFDQIDELINAQE
jgi:hypothetical protein